MFFSDWLTTLSLVFGGCCSNAITLEQLTSQYPQAGSLITFSQFLLISLHGLPKHVIWTPYGPRLKPRNVPLTVYIAQVALFYFVSLLNNAAFGYRIPMAVHIIFRSGGLIISMALGWLISNKRYNAIQVSSVFLVTFGVILTTLSASSPSPTSSNLTAQHSTFTYLKGISILTLALLLSGFLGLVQDWTFTNYGRPTLPSTVKSQSNGTAKPLEHSSKTEPSTSPAWQESMFYLHFLALPMFLPLFPTLRHDLATINQSSLISLPMSFMGTTLLPLSLPNAYLPLVLNTLTQLFCVAGVNRLTTRVSALTVTLILVVRKAASLVLSVLGVGGVVGARDVRMTMMWTGAAMVLLGTVGYTTGTGISKQTKQKGKKE